MTNTVGAVAMGAKRPARLDLSVQYASLDAAVPTRAQLRAWARAALVGAGVVTIRLVDAEEAQGLNRDYRGRDYATNVLSFPYTPSPDLAGDLVLCVPVVKREAAEQGKALEAHFAHLVVHGILHLQGLDHETHSEAELMESRERDIMASLAYPDPYVNDHLKSET